MAGLRIAVTTTVGLGSLAFLAGAGGLGEALFDDINFRSNVLVAGGLAVAARDRPRPRRARAADGDDPLDAGGGGMTTTLACPRRVRGRDQLHLPIARVQGGRRARRRLGEPAAAVDPPEADRAWRWRSRSRVSLPLGLLLGHTGRGAFATISISNVGRAVPSIALIAFFVAFFPAHAGLLERDRGARSAGDPADPDERLRRRPPGQSRLGRRRARDGHVRPRRSSAPSSSRSPSR